MGIKTLPRVAVIIGSKSDRPAIEPALKVLTALKIPWELSVFSCHRHGPELQRYLASFTELSYVRVVIAVAGMAAALPGVIASVLKGSGIVVIGVALKSGDIGDGLDALYSMTRLPAGIPLLCAGLGQAAPTNAALAAAEILTMTGDDSFLEGLRHELQLYLEELGRQKPAEPNLEFWPSEET